MKKILLLLFSFGVLTVTNAQIIDVIGVGTTGDELTTLTIPNPENVTQMQVGTHHKGGPLEVEGVMLSGDNIFCNLITGVYYKSVVPDVNVGSYLESFPDANGGSVELNSDPYEDFIHSLFAFVFRSIPTPDRYSVSDNAPVFFYRNGVNAPYVYTLPINQSHTNRDITVVVPISELASHFPFNRKAVIDVEAGGVTAHLELNTNNLGELLNITPMILNNVPWDATSVEVSIYSPATLGVGDSFISGGAVATVDEAGLGYCSLTQGFYGNAGGKHCDETTTVLLDRLLLNNPLVVGDDGNTLTIDNSGCVIDLLPGGGPSKSIKNESECGDLDKSIKTHKKSGRIKNSLLAQTITLGLNLRLDQNLGDLLLLGDELVTLDAIYCDNPYGGDNGNPQSFFIDQDVIDYLSNNGDNSIDALFALANLAVGGSDIGDLSLSQVTDAAAAINEGFDECRVLDVNQSFKAATAQINPENTQSENLFVYPNPVTANSTIEFVSKTDARTVAELTNIMGKKVDVLFDEVTAKDGKVSFSINGNSYPRGMYILVIRNGSNVLKQKIAIVK